VFPHREPAEAQQDRAEFFRDSVVFGDAVVDYAALTRCERLKCKSHARVA
jgi:hypothetical protein